MIRIPLRFSQRYYTHAKTRCLNAIVSLTRHCAPTSTYTRNQVSTLPHMEIYALRRACMCAHTHPVLQALRCFPGPEKPLNVGVTPKGVQNLHPSRNAVKEFRNGPEGTQLMHMFFFLVKITKEDFCHRVPCRARRVKPW